MQWSEDQAETTEELENLHIAPTYFGAAKAHAFEGTPLVHNRVLYCNKEHKSSSHVIPREIQRERALLVVVLRTQAERWASATRNTRHLAIALASLDNPIWPALLHLEIRESMGNALRYVRNAANESAAIKMNPS